MDPTLALVVIIIVCAIVGIVFLLRGGGGKGNGGNAVNSGGNNHGGDTGNSDGGKSGGINIAGSIGKIGKGTQIAGRDIKTTNIKIGSISIVLAIALGAFTFLNPGGVLGAGLSGLSIGGSNLPDGIYEKVGDGGVGIGFNEFTVKGSTITVNVMGLYGMDYEYKIDGNQIKLTSQGGTLSYSYEKKNSSYIINGGEYQKK